MLETQNTQLVIQCAQHQQEIRNLKVELASKTRERSRSPRRVEPVSNAVGDEADQATIIRLRREIASKDAEIAGLRALGERYTDISMLPEKMQVQIVQLIAASQRNAQIRLAAV